ncbi:MlaD family protein [Flavobacteriales bacterium]|jgi:phospholipid/cholesterol/gamma-HCH transport system substrate-binding protein|nr:MlaD family protein [Flavobacteriales bacterium]MDC3394848.1 MlaD family protein [Flavobacteriales bacterium]MDG1348978.1 MlaD family protein [Flavobacteriales bacterium]
MNKELKIGLLAVVAIIFLVFGVNYLKGINILNDNRNFYAVYENIGGLQVGSPVMVNGYKVGLVSNVDLLIENNQQLLVTISIEKEFSIPSNTVCKIVNQDLMGTKGISLVLGDATNFLSVGDTLNGGIEGTLQDEVNAQILPLKNKAEQLIGSMDSVMMIVTAVLNKDTRESLRNSLQSLDKTFSLMSETMIKVDSMVAVNDERITKVISNLASITSNLESSNGEIKNILTNFSTLSDSLAKADIATALKNVSDITAKINNGEGSIGLLLKDDKIYANFEKSTRELAELLEDIKRHPSRYVNFSIIGGSKSYVEPKSKK